MDACAHFNTALLLVHLFYFLSYESVCRTALRSYDWSGRGSSTAAVVCDISCDDGVRPSTAFGSPESLRLDDEVA
jgi:hypothetical protein